MARPIGGMFLHAAHGPVAFAASCIAHNQILKGLEELDPAGLAGGLERGVHEVARLTGVPAREVWSLLPTERIRDLTRRLDRSQPGAVAAWRMHAGAFGFLDVITQLTVDGRPVAIGSALSRLALKVRADEGLSAPLLALAEDVGEWDTLIHDCRAILDDGEALARAFKLRRQRRAAVAIVAAVVIVVALSVMGVTAAARGRVDAALGSPDPCAAAAISTGDRELASNEQDRALSAAERRCAEDRAREAEARERARREAEAAAEAERARREHRERCAAAARSLASGADAPRDGDEGSLEGRVRSRRLTASDLGPQVPSAPCFHDDATPPAVRAALDAAFFEAVMAFPGGWVHVIDPSPWTEEVLAAHLERIAPWQRSLLAARADRDAERALLGGDPTEAARARRTCRLAARLGVPGGASCTGLAGLTDAAAAGAN